MFKRRLTFTLKNKGAPILRKKQLRNFFEEIFGIYSTSSENLIK